jgi:hypothetical protein
VKDYSLKLHWINQHTSKLWLDEAISGCDGVMHLCVDGVLGPIRFCRSNADPNADADMNA